MKTNKVVLDSCVFSKQFLKEDDSYQTNVLIHKLIKNKVKILVPSLFVYEVLATVTIGNYSVKKAYDLLVSFQKSLLQTVELDDVYLTDVTQ